MARKIPTSKGEASGHKEPKASSPYRVIILPDMQIPYQDDRALALVERYMADNTWDEWLQMGDFMDFDCISRFNADAFRKVENMRLASDYEDANKILDRHQKIIRKNNPDAKFTLLEGNHELRVEKFMDKYQQLEGTLEVEKCLRLKERGIKWVRCYQKGDNHKIGNAYFTHGISTTSNHASAMVRKFGTNIYYGHTHDVQSFPLVQMGSEKTLEGMSLGCLCIYNMPYVQKNPTNWQQAFAVMYVFPDGYYNLFVVKLFKHRFIAPDGKVYS